MLKSMVGGSGGNFNKNFITIWNTANAGTSSSTQITWPTVSGGTYNCTVYWGDGTISNVITTYNDAAWTHTYPSSGIYTVTIVGTFTQIYFNSGGDCLKLLKITSWGGFGFGNTSGACFRGCSNLTITATNLPSFTGTTSLTIAFNSCSKITTIPNIANWNMSSITNMANMFSSCTLFNDPGIASWNVSNVTNMSFMFTSCTNFNQSLNSWNVSKVTNMNTMFASATSFNGNITSWNTVALAGNGAGALFNGCTSFNQAIGGWNMASVTGANNMFLNCTVFNQDLSSWNVGNITNMSGMFQNCPAFNQNISGWNTAKVTNMSSMFATTTTSAFQQNLGAWNITALVSGATGGTGMFTGCTLTNANYNGLLAGWGAQVPKTGVTFSGGNSHYDTTSGGYNGTAGRAVLTGTYTWLISDGGTP